MYILWNTERINGNFLETTRKISHTNQALCTLLAILSEINKHKACLPPQNEYFKYFFSY